MMPLSWSEPYDDFLLFLEQAGIVVAGLPDWQPSTPVHVIVDPGRGVFWLKRTSPRAVKRSGAMKRPALRRVPFDELRRCYTLVQITSFDRRKLALF